MGKLLEDFLDAADQLRPEAFETKYSPGFLIIHGEATNPQIRPVSVDFRTQVTDPSVQAVQIPALMMSEVYDLGMFSGNREVSIGRGLDVDLFLSDATVSRLHATLSWNQSGRVYLRHAGGRSPTRVDTNVVGAEMDSALEVLSGCMLQIGNVRLSFLNPVDFQRLLWRLSTEDKISGA
jgi:hypothetical protein